MCFRNFSIGINNITENKRLIDNYSNSKTIKINSKWPCIKNDNK